PAVEADRSAASAGSAAPAVAAAAAPTSVPSAAASTPATVAPEPTQAAPSAGSVGAVEGSGYQYTLRVNGKPTIVRGMGYNPWYADLPEDERHQQYRRDFSAMREIGVNTLEGWFQQQFDEVTLDET